MSLIFDTHAHYDDEAFDADREALLASMPEHGVGLILDPGCDLESSRRAVELARTYPRVYAAVGWASRELRALHGGQSGRASRVGAGAEGRCHRRDRAGLLLGAKPAAGASAEGAARSARAGAGAGPPVIVHDREAHADSLAIVQEFPAVRGVFHCFSGSVEMARELLKRGWYLGFDGPVTYKSNKKAAEVLAVTPLERILVETDSPYMAPEPCRGKRNDSSLLVYVLEKIAALKGVSAEEMTRITQENGCRLFGIEA